MKLIYELQRQRKAIRHAADTASITSSFYSLGFSLFDAVAVVLEQQD